MRHRYATRDDVAQWFGHVPSTMRALVIENGGEVIAIAGLSTMADHVQAFSEIKPAARHNRIALGRMAVAFGRLLAQVRGPVFAVCEEAEPTSPGLLAHFGFQQQTDAIWRRG